MEIKECEWCYSELTEDHLTIESDKINIKRPGVTFYIRGKHHFCDIGCLAEEINNGLEHYK